LWLLVLVGKGSLHLQLLWCLVSRDKSGVARLCSVMTEMSSHLRSYGPASGRAGRSLCYSHIHHTKNCTCSYYSLNSLITKHTIFNRNQFMLPLMQMWNFIWLVPPEL
jgi:hypothetical protein